MRMSRGRKPKPKTRWLQDSAFQNVNTIATSTGIIPTTTLSFFNDMSSGAMGDPPGVLGTAVPSGIQLQTNVSPRAQLLSLPGWRIMRIVGDHHIAIKQTVSGPEAAAATPIWAVTMGLCLLERDERDGTFVDEDDWQLGYPNVFSVITEADKASAMEGMGRSWIWRRTWLLQNYLAGQTAGGDGAMGDLVNAYQLSGNDLFPYGIGFSSNDKYPSALLGSHFDIKRHVTFKRRQEPVWRFHAIDLTGNGAGFAEFMMLRSYRTLIAKAGRPWKDER